MPAMVGECCYEGHMQTAFQDVQRYVFWATLLSGSAGHTYGAAGVWHANVEGDPGIANVYDFTTWKEGMNFPGWSLALPDRRPPGVRQLRPVQDSVRSYEPRAAEHLAFRRRESQGDAPVHRRVPGVSPALAPGLGPGAGEVVSRQSLVVRPCVRRDHDGPPEGAGEAAPVDPQGAWKGEDSIREEEREGR